MKKLKLLLTTLACIGCLQVYSQSMYTQFSVGYGLPSGSQQVGSVYKYDESQGNYYEESVNGSFGSGLNFTGSFGYMFTPSIGLDVSVNYLLGNTYTSSDNYEYFDYKEVDESELKSSGFSIAPSLLINFGGTKFSPYAKLGVAVGSFTVKGKDREEYFYSGQVDTSVKEETKTTGDLSIGIRGGIGLAYFISGNISLYGECLYTGMSFKPKETELTSSTFNGQDQLDQMNEYDKRTVYLKKVNYENYNPDEPREELQTPAPLSSISFNFGVRFAFGGI